MNLILFFFVNCKELIVHNTYGGKTGNKGWQSGLFFGID